MFNTRGYDDNSCHYLAEKKGPDGNEKAQKHRRTGAGAVIVEWKEKLNLKINPVVPKWEKWSAPLKELWEKQELGSLKIRIHKSVSNVTSHISLASPAKPKGEIQMVGSKGAIILLTAVFNSTIQGRRVECIFKDGVRTMVTLKVIVDIGLL